MKNIVFDVMCNGRFVMQFTYRWCPAFAINLDDVLREVLVKRPTLKGKRVELFETENIVK